MSWLHAIFELSMLVGFALAVYEIRKMQSMVKDMHHKLCCDDDKHLGI